MNKYLGVKLIEAEPMTRGEYNEFRGWTIPENEDPSDEGCIVKYSDDYVSWTPKEVFESSYLHLEDIEGKSVKQADVDNFIKFYEDFKLGDKTTVVKATLINNFEIVGSSSCVDPSNFNQDLGINYSLDEIKDKVWGLLGFLLQCGVNGFKNKN
jgi:hypothetical protein